MAAVPIPTTNLAKSIKIREGASALRTLPNRKTAIPSKSVLRLPKMSPSFPRMGAQAAVEIACARAVQVVLLYARFISCTKAGPKTVLRPPTMPTKKAAKA